jgi:hypothetical protein
MEKKYRKHLGKYGTYGKYNRYIYIWKHLGTNMETYSRIYDSIWTLKGENREFL